MHSDLSTRSLAKFYTYERTSSSLTKRWGLFWTLKLRIESICHISSVGYEEDKFKTLIKTSKSVCIVPDSKVHGANMGPIWGQQDPCRPHVCPMSFAIWGRMRAQSGQVNVSVSSIQWCDKSVHDDVIKWKHLPRYWAFVRGIHRSPRIPQQRQVTRSLDVSLICVWLNGWVNNRDASDLRRHHAHYSVTVMSISLPCSSTHMRISGTGDNTLRIRENGYHLASDIFR